MVRMWLRWSWRDLRQRWLLVTSISLVMALGTGSYAALTGTSEWRRQSNDASFAAVGMHDLRVALNPGTTADRGRLEAVLRSISRSAQVLRARERLLVPTQLSVRSGRGEVVVAATVVGHSGLTGRTVDAIHVGAGRAPRPQEGTAALEQKFARWHGLRESGTVSLAGGHRLRYVGLAVGPEEFVVTGRGGTSFLGEAAFATAYTDLATAQALSPALAGQVNDLVVRLRPGGDRAGVVAELAAAFARADPPLAVQVLTREEDPAYRILYKDIEGDEKIWTVIALLVLLGATFAAVNLTTRVVEAQRREIGIGMALGLGGRALAVRPMLLGAQIALSGTLLGILVARALGAPLADLYSDVLPLPVWRTPLQLEPFLRAAIAGVVLPMLAVALPVWRAVRVEPVEAIRVGHLAARSSRLLGRTRWIRLPGRGFRSMPLRNLARTPRRTALTALAVAASITSLVAIGGLLDSFRGAVAVGEAELARGADNRVMVTMDRWHPVGAAAVRQVRDLPEVGQASMGLQVPMTARAHGTKIDLVTEVLPADSLWQPTILAGRRSGGLVLGERAAADLGVGVGDAVAVRYPQPVAGGARNQDRRVLVVGLHPNPLRVLAYVDSGAAATLGLRGVVNRIHVLPAEGVGVAALRAALFAQPAVATVEDVTSASRVLDDSLEQFVGVLVVMAGAVLLLALLIAYNSSTISADERAREHATMLAFGLRVRSLLAMLTVESIATGVLGSLTGLVTGLLMVRWVVATIVPQTLPDFAVSAVVGAGTMAAALVVGIGAVALAPAFTLRRLRRIDVPSTLRVIE